MNALKIRKSYMSKFKYLLRVVMETNPLRVLAKWFKTSSGMIIIIVMYKAPNGKANGKM